MTNDHPVRLSTGWIFVGSYCEGLDKFKSREKCLTRKCCRLGRGVDPKSLLGKKIGKTGWGDINKIYGRCEN